MALYFECRINKNALFQIVFLVILPTGIIFNGFFTQQCSLLRAAGSILTSW